MRKRALVPLVERRREADHRRPSRFIWSPSGWLFDKFLYCHLPAPGQNRLSGSLGGLLLGGHNPDTGDLVYIGDVGLLTGLTEDTPAG